MASTSESVANHGVIVNVKDACDDRNNGSTKDLIKDSDCLSIPFIQKIIAEVIGTYFLIFAGGGSVVVNLNKLNVTFPGIAITWGLICMVMIYSVGHISGAHFNPSVTIAFATIGRFPWIQVIPFIIAQVVGSTLAAGSLRLIFTGKEDHFSGTTPDGSDIQAFVLELIITFLLMFVVSGVATDNRAIGELAGIAIGSTVVLNVLVAGPITGASMNPARSIGPAIVYNQWRGIWIYMVAPPTGAIAGAWVYNCVRFTNKPLRELTRSGSFLKGVGR